MRFIIAACVITAVLASRDSTPSCSEANYRYAFTNCDEASNLMSAVTYFNISCYETDEVYLPSPVQVPCSRDCGNGRFYSAQSADCEQCPLGAFSISDSRVINDFSTFPQGFTTYCSPMPCATWRVSPVGDMDSGNQSLFVRKSKWMPTLADESVEVTLVTLANVVQPTGSIEFSYRVESEERYDGFNVFLNGSLYHADNSQQSSGGSNSIFDTWFAGDFLLSGLFYSWRRASIPLPNGQTEIRFVYKKDSDSSSSVARTKGIGQDRAFLRNIVIHGVQKFAFKCTPCPPGTFTSQKGSTQCTPCRSDSASGRGASSCTACASNSWAPSGSPSCHKKLPCTLDDYEAQYGPCDSTSQQRAMTWVLRSHRCVEDPNNKPRPSVASCVTCLEGFKYDQTMKTCSACPMGQKRLPDLTCSACSSGRIGVPTLSFANGFIAFSQDASMFPKYFSQKCDGHCAGCNSDATCSTTSGAFDVVTVVDNPTDMQAPNYNTMFAIRNNIDTGSSFTSSLSFPFSVVSPGWLEVSYYFVLHGASAGASKSVSEFFSVVATVDNKEYPFDANFLRPDMGKLTVNVPRVGNHELRITVTQRDGASDLPSFNLAGLKVYGDPRGASTSCSDCLAGYFCAPGADRMKPCPAAHYAARTGAAQCDNCPTNTIAKDEGQHSCRQCPQGTVAAATQDRCENTCLVEMGGNKYNFTLLRGHIFGPVFRDVENNGMSLTDADAIDATRFFVSFCSYVNTADVKVDTCKSSDGSAIERTYVCERLNANRGFSSGDFVSYAFSSDAGLSVQFTGGDVCHHGGMERSTNISLVCAPNEPGFGRLTYVNEFPHCKYNMAFTSQYACPACTKDAFTVSTGKCHNGFRNASYLKQPYASSCRGGYVPPADYLESCDFCSKNDFELHKTDCVNGHRGSFWVKLPNRTNCTDDGSVWKDLPRTVQIERCSTVEVQIGANKFTGVLIGVGLVLVALVAMLVFIYVKHKKLVVQYGRLASSATEGEMHDVPTVEDELPEDA